jgi:hypothetical protein
MDIYEPRKRIALDVEAIQDSEVKELLTKLSELQKEVQGLNSGLGTQVNAGIQEAQAMIEKMTKVNQDFDEMLSSIKNQVQQLTNAAIQYVQMNSAGLQDEQPKFRDSFLYITKQATSNIQKLVSGIQTQVGDVLQVIADSTPIQMDMQPDEAAVDMTPENLLTSSINAARDSLRQRIAALLPAVMKTIEKIEPIVNQANNVNQNTEKLVLQLQDVIGTIPQTEEPVVEETEAFNPDIPAAEVDEAAGLEEDMNLEEAPAAEIEAPAEEAAEEPAAAFEGEPGEPAAEEEAEATPEAAEEEGEPAAEETEEILEESEEEAIIEDEPVEPAAEKEE